MFAGLKVACLRKWAVSKHDVKGAFLNAWIHKLVIVSPPAQWVKWGIVPAGVTWTLDKAVYGLRESPKLWGDERDGQLRNVEWKAEERAAAIINIDPTESLTSKTEETANEPSKVPMIPDGRPVHQDDSWGPSAGGRPVHQDDNRAAVGTESGDAADFEKKLKEAEEALLGEEERIIKELEQVRVRDKHGKTFYWKPCASD